jgi:hypothetical protein
MIYDNTQTINIQNIEYQLFRIVNIV